MRHPKYALSYRAKPVTHTFNAQNNLNLNNEHELAFKNHIPAMRLVLFRLQTAFCKMSFAGAEISCLISTRTHFRVFLSQ